MKQTTYHGYDIEVSSQRYSRQTFASFVIYLGVNPVHSDDSYESEASALYAAKEWINKKEKEEANG